MTDADKAFAIFERYRDHHSGDLRGAFIVIADEIQQAIGGVCVAGQLFWKPGVRVTHWWVEKNGVVYDPMGGHVLSDKTEPKGRHEVHRDRAVFDIVIQKFEPWRIKS